ncbi:MAG: hypothetical protein DRQ06_05970 [Candidatus Hydrothermota bacterium]|nr:MAG: hypothetical protein DRQ06_05970 [Candidatus Hydrothermae bacterium]
MIIDAREPENIYKDLKSKVECRKEFLEVGDYLLNNGYAIERKHTDLVSSILNRRIFDQLNNLCEYEHPILCYDVDNLWRTFYFSHSRYIHKQYLGFLTTLTIKYPNLKIIPYSGINQFIDYVVSLDKKLNENQKDKVRPSPILRKAMSIQDRRENALTAIEGISIAKSKKLLKHFNTLSEIANANLEELENIPGIGKKLASNIYEVFH